MERERIEDLAKQAAEPWINAIDIDEENIDQIDDDYYEFWAGKDLQDKGFIEKVCSGGLRGDSKSYSKYRLSNEWKAEERKRLMDMAIYRIQSKNGNKAAMQ
jgi:hypothetical protein